MMIHVISMIDFEEGGLWVIWLSLNDDWYEFISNERRESWLIQCTIFLYLSEPSFVSNPRITESGAYHFKVEWEPPAQPNGIIAGYTVGHKLCKHYSCCCFIEFTNHFDLAYICDKSFCKRNILFFMVLHHYIKSACPFYWNDI